MPDAFPVTLTKLLTEAAWGSKHSLETHSSRRFRALWLRKRGEEARPLEWKGEAATAHTAWPRRHTAPSRGRGQESHRRPTNSSSRFDCLPWQPYPQRTIYWNTRSVRTSHIKLQHLSHAHDKHMTSALTTEPQVRLFPPSLTLKRLDLGRSSKIFKAMHLVRTGDIVLT